MSIASDHLLDLIVSETRDYAIFMLDVNGHVETWNAGAEHFTGYAAKEILSRRFSTFYTPEDVAAGKPEDELQAAADAGRFEDEGWRVRKDGSRFWANVVITALRDEYGALRGFGQVTRDLTERRNRELAEGYERFERMVQNVRDYAIFMLDVDGHVLTWNAGAELCKGYAAEEIVGRHFSAFYTPEDITAGRPTRQLLDAATEGRSEDDGWRVRKDGSRFWANVVITALRDSDGTLRGFGKVTRDLTAQREQELKLRAGEERVRAVLDAAPDAMIVVDAEGIVQRINDQTVWLLGYARQELVGQSIDVLLPATGRGPQAGLREAYAAQSSATQARVETELNIRHKSGDEMPVAMTLSAVNTADGVLTTAAFRDVRERRVAQQRLSAAEERFRQSFENAPIGMAIVGLDGECIDANTAFSEIVGYPRSTLAGLARDVLTHPDDVQSDSKFAEALLDPECRKGVRETRYLHADGHVVWVLTNVTLIRDASGQPDHFIVQVEDITERRQDEASLQAHVSEQEALRALATLVASEAEPRAIHAAATQRAAEVLHAEFASVACLGPGGEGRLVGSWSAEGLPLAPPGQMLDLHGPSALSAALRTGRPANVVRHGRPLDKTRVSVGSDLAAPIMVGGRIWGAISVGWTREAAADAHAGQRIARVADLVSLAVSGAEARSELSRLASTDPLTGLYNQRSFFDRLEGEIERARRHERPISLIVLDLDHFKLVNDSHGHEAGNTVLIEFSRRLTSVSRNGEMLARVGGEEFAWILPDTSGEDARKAAERARHIIADTAFDGVGKLTTSLGVCSLEDAHDAAELFRNADLALYWSKTSGRNMSTRYHPGELSRVTAAHHTDHVRRAQALAAVRALAAAVDAKHPGTQRHCERVAALAAYLASAGGWAEGNVAMLREAALVHEVGKIAIPEQLLLNHDVLTPTGYEQLQCHAVLGAQMLDDLLNPEQTVWIRHQYERHDGTGYPDRLAGDRIPEGARVLAIADAWDAMTVAGSAGPPRPIDAALDEIERRAGTQFCPEAVDVLSRAYLRGDLSETRSA